MEASVGVKKPEPKVWKRVRPKRALVHVRLDLAHTIKLEQIKMLRPQLTDLELVQAAIDSEIERTGQRLKPPIVRAPRISPDQAMENAKERLRKLNEERKIEKERAVKVELELCRH